jgi:ionotropic glutamate receptor
VLVLSSCYTANLSSLLTVQKLRSERDIEWLKQNKLPVGCANKSTFLKDYLVQVYDFPTDQIVDVKNEQDIVDKFKSKKISALFTESPYAKVFLNKHSKGYTATTAAYKFGGMGFVSACNFFGLFTLFLIEKLSHYIQSENLASCYMVFSGISKRGSNSKRLF